MQKACNRPWRGELEISSINQIYLQQAQLNVVHMGRGSTWLDSGTHDAILAASQYIETIEKRQGLKNSVPRRSSVSLWLYR